MAAQVETRQKLLLLLLVVVAGYAAFDYLDLQKGSKAPVVQKQSSRADFEKKVMLLTTRMAGEKLSEVGLYKVARIGDDLVNMPFYKSESSFFLTGMQDEAFSTEIEGREVAYTGYVEINGARFAILNNIEYAAGDEFIIEGYRVAQIAKQFVVLEKHADNGVPGARVKVPMVEDARESVNIRVGE